MDRSALTARDPRCRLSAAERDELFDIYLAHCRWTRIYFLWRPGKPNMPRPILDESRIHPAVRDKIATNRIDIVREVEAAIAANAVVVVGMRQNPAPRRARRVLDDAKIQYKYLEYGSYLSEWRRRNALKMWTGWPTFPMVFVKGVLVGGADDLEKLIASGELAKLVG
jgi:glutaredoxin-related protein